MKNDDIKVRVKSAVDRFRQKDKALIQVDANERSLSHKLAMYLQEQFESDGWDVDCEYNRFGGGDKKTAILFDELGEWLRCDVPITDEEAKTIFPDIIVHHRRKSDNLLAIEVKKSTTANDGRLDIQKLEALTCQRYKYKYQLGLHLIISMDLYGNLDDKYYWYEDGEKR